MAVAQPFAGRRGTSPALLLGGILRSGQGRQFVEAPPRISVAQSACQSAAAIRTSSQYRGRCSATDVGELGGRRSGGVTSTCITDSVANVAGRDAGRLQQDKNTRLPLASRSTGRSPGG